MFLHLLLSPILSDSFGGFYAKHARIGNVELERSSTVVAGHQFSVDCIVRDIDFAVAFQTVHFSFYSPPHLVILRGNLNLLVYGNSFSFHFVRQSELEKISNPQIFQSKRKSVAGLCSGLKAESLHQKGSPVLPR
jgi:hypothetical protein